MTKQTSCSPNIHSTALTLASSYFSSFFDYRFRNSSIPGFVAALAHRGKLRFCRAYGFADLGRRIPLRSDHIFRVASHSKVFTAAAVMQLAEQGKLRLDAPVSTYLRALKSARDKRVHRITVRELLSHGSGVIRNGRDADYWQYLRPYPSASEVVKEVARSGLILENNTTFKYSNYGYGLLGAVVEKCSGMPYAKYVERNIVAKLKLKRTGPEWDRSLAAATSLGYSREDGRERNRIPMPPLDTRGLASATGFYSCAEDLCRFARALCFGDETLLSDSTKREMHHGQWQVPMSRPPRTYALGLDIRQVGGRTILGHGGVFPGYITRTMFDPVEQLVAVVLTNCVDGPALEIAQGMIRTVDTFNSLFLSAAGHSRKKSQASFLGRFCCIWKELDLIRIGDRVLAGNPESWEPFADCEELSVVDGRTFKIEKCDGYRNQGELVKLTTSSSKRITKIRYGGTTLIPEERYSLKDAIPPS